MNRVLWKKMAMIIKKYRTWITIQDIRQDDWFMFISGGVLKKYASPVFQLIVKWPRGNKVRGQVVGISEYELDRAIRKLSRSDDVFHEGSDVLSLPPMMWNL